MKAPVSLALVLALVLAAMSALPLRAEKLTPLSPAGTGSPGETAPKPTEILLNFQGAEIQAVIKALAEMTGQNFILDPRVKGQITIISARPVKIADAYEIILAALKAQGFIAAEGPAGSVKILPAAEAKQHAAVNTRPAAPRGEAIVTHVAIVQNASATQLIPLLRPLMAPTSQLAAYEPANALLITDYADNIRRLLRVIESLDQPSSSEVTVIPLKHASALDIAELLARLSATPGQTVAPAAAAAGGAGAGRFVVIPDLRTNSLLISTDNIARLNQWRALIEKLDVPATRGGHTRVIYLKNAEAIKVAELLRALLAAEWRNPPPLAAGGSAAASSAATAASGLRRLPEPALVQADEATNALIISATDTVYNDLRSVIEKLDIRRAQVFVEALIAEVSTTEALQVGFQWFAAKDVDGGRAALGGVQNFPAAPGLVASAVEPVTVLGASPGLTLGYLGEKIVVGGKEIFGLGALARFLEQNARANILSTPNLMTLDNAEAKIVVGQNVPFLTGSFAQATGTTGVAVNPFQTIERRDVGLILRIKPQITEGGRVKLEIATEVSSVSATTEQGVITNKRNLETKIVVDNGHTIVLGGLIDESDQRNTQSVPWLSRIPLLGALFRYRSDEKKKTNLLVFLRPQIVHTPEEGYRVTLDRYEYLRWQTGLASGARAAQIERFAPAPPAATTAPPTDRRREESDVERLLGPPEIRLETSPSYQREFPDTP
jgi:general secretion pathway protein D